MTWQIYCPDCGYVARKLTQEKAQFYADLHKANHGHRVLMQAQDKKGRVAMGKMA